MKRSETNAQNKNDSPWKENSSGGQDHCGEPWQSLAALSVFYYTTRWEQTPGASLHTERKGRIRGHYNPVRLAMYTIYDIWLRTTICNRILDFLACRPQTDQVVSLLVQHQSPGLCAQPPPAHTVHLWLHSHTSTELYCYVCRGDLLHSSQFFFLFFLVMINIRS